MSLDVSLRVAIFWVAVILCVVAEAAILRSTFRGSRAAGANTSEAAVPRARGVMELIWAVVPAIVLVFVLLATRNAIR